MIGLVGAIDVGFDLADLVQVQHRDAGGLEPIGGSIGARHRAGDGDLARREFVDEEVDGGAGADAEYFAGLHVFQRRARRGLFSSVFGHFMGTAHVIPRACCWSCPTPK